MGKGNKKKRMQKYTKKYYTGGRIDMSKGGRVSLQEGGNPPKYGDYRINEDGVREQFSPVGWNPTKEQPKPSEPSKPTTPPPPTSQEPPMSVGGIGGGNAPTEPEPKETTPPPAPPAQEPPSAPPAQEPPSAPPAQEPPSAPAPTEPSITDIEDGGKGRVDDEFRDRDFQDDITTPPPGSGDTGGQDTTTPPPQETVTEQDSLKDLPAAYSDKGIKGQEMEAQKEKGARVIETGRQAQQMAQGIMPEDMPTIPDPKKIERADTEITPEQAAELQMEATKQAEAAKVAAVSPEQVSIINDVETAAAPKPFDIATIEAEDVAKVPEDAVVEAATGSVSPEVSETLAKAAGVQAVAPIEAAEVEVLPGALQERVVGTISPEAKAQAAKVAGTTLAKVTRAKKQLRNAGLSEEDIAELGNDPEALEVRLTDFTEEQRGIVEGLPEEALVSNQIDSLLSGVEDGNIPTWAKPAVASVEAMLAQRGMSASTVGRDALLNAIITSALPIAQANAQAIQTSVSQQKSIEATAALKDAEMAQQTALFNAQNVFQMDMAQFSADQQRAVNNSKFLQTASLQNATMEQQGVMQDAVLMAQRNLAEADQNTKLGIENAKAFLAMDIQNLNNEQQASILKAQQIQQRLLSNQAAENAALQFNATSENQVNQFMTSIKAQTDQFNATQTNAMAQFNANSENAAEARRAGRDFEAARIDAQLATEIDKFNSAQDFAREQFNVQNETAIAQSNVQWRRQANTADTAAINAVNQQNAQNAFGLTASAMNFLWQEVRDEADFIFKRWDNDQQRKTSLMIAALGNEAGTASDTSWSTNLSAITQLVNGWLD
jgi:hypothetical protein